MAKTGEISLRASERLKGFDKTKFKADDIVVYKEGGSWKSGKLKKATAGQPVIEDDGRSITLHIVGRAEVKNINIPPKKVEFKKDDVVKNFGKVQRFFADGDGNIFYDVKDGTKEYKGVSQEMLLSGREAKNIAEKLEKSISRLLDKVKKIQGAERAKLMTDLNKMKEKTVVLDRIVLKNKEILTKAQEADFLDLKNQIEKVNGEINDAVAALETEVSKVTKAEEESKRSADKRKKGEAAKNLEEASAVDIKTADDKEKQRYKKDKDSWDQKKAAYDKWKNDLQEAEKDVRDAFPKKQKGQQPTQEEADKLKELKGVVEELKKPGNRVEDPGPEPKENLPSASEAAKDDILLKRFDQMESSRASLPSESQALIDEVLKKRQEKTKQQGMTTDFPKGDRAFGDLNEEDKKKLAKKKADYAKKENDYNEFLTYRENTVKILREVMSKWQEEGKTLPEVKTFDFEKEKNELEDKAKELVERLEKSTKPTAPALAGDVKVKVLDVLATYNKTTSDVDQKMIDLWNVLGELQVETFKIEEKAEPALKRETKVGYVDLPKSIMVEWLKLQSPLIKEAMGDAYTAKITEGADSATAMAGLVEKMKRFLDGVTITDAVRDELARHGITNWENFKERWKDKMAGQFAEMLAESADTELKAMLVRSTKDIRSADTSLQQRIKDAWEFSTLRNMKGAAAWRMAINTVAVGGTAFGVGMLAKLIPSSAVAAGLTGGVTGLVKAGVQRLMGKEGGYFQNELEHAKKTAEAKKKKLIMSELLKESFDQADAFQGGAEDRMAYLFTGILRRVSEKEIPGGRVETIKGPNGETDIDLRGDDVCLYYDALKMAAEDAGENIEDSEKVKYQLAATLYAMSNNKRYALKEVPPAAVRATQWLMDAYSGRMSTKPGREGLFAGGAGGEKVDGTKQALVTAGIGALVGLAYDGVKQEVLGRSAVRGAIAGVAGFAAGERAQYQAERSKAEKEAGKFLDTFVAKINRLLDQTTKTEEDTKKIVEYNTYITFLLKGADLDHVPPVTNLAKADIDYLVTHTKDVVLALQNNQMKRSTLESVRREISRSGELQKGALLARLDSMKKVTDDLLDATEAKNSVGVRLLNSLKRHGRGALYGLGYGLTAAAVGTTVDAMRGRSIFGTSTSEPAKVDHGAEAILDKKGSGPIAAATAVQGGRMATGAGLDMEQHVKGAVGKEVGSDYSTGEKLKFHEAAAPANLEVDGMKVRGNDIGTLDEGAVVDARGPWQAGMKLQEWFKAHNVKWSNTEVVNELKRHGYKFTVDSQGKLVQENHPITFLKDGGKLVPWVDADGKPHFEIVDVKGGKGINMVGWVRKMEGEKIDFPEPTKQAVAPKEGMLVDRFKDPELGNVVDIETGKYGPRLRLNFDEQGKYLGHSGSAERPLDEAIGEIYKQAPEAKDGISPAELSSQARLTRSIDDLDNAYQVMQKSGSAAASSAEAQGLASEIRSMMGYMANNTHTAIYDLYQPEFLHRYFPDAVIPTESAAGVGGDHLGHAKEIGTGGKPHVFKAEEWGGVAKGVETKAVSSAAAVVPETQPKFGIAENIKAIESLFETRKENWETLSLKVVDLRDAINDGVGNVTYSNKAAETMASHLLDQLDDLSNKVSTKELDFSLVNKLLTADFSHASGQETYQMFKEFLPKEAYVLFGDSNATLGGPRGGDYTAVVSDEPSHAVALIDKEGHRSIFVSDVYEISRADNGEVVLTDTKLGVSYKGELAFGPSPKNYPVVARGKIEEDLKDFVGPVQPKTVKAPHADRPSIARPQIDRQPVVPAAPVEALKSTFDFATALEQGNYSPAEKINLQNINNVLEMRSQVWGVDGKGLEGFVRQNIPAAEANMDNPRVKEWLSGLLRDHQTTKDTLIKDLQAGKSYNTIVGDLSSKMAGAVENYPNGQRLNMFPTGKKIDINNPNTMNNYNEREVYLLKEKFNPIMDRINADAVAEQNRQDSEFLQEQ